MKIRHRHGVTFTDVVVVLSIALLLLAFISRSAQNANEINNRVRCAMNLKQIGLAIQLYSNENGGMYPRTIYVPDAPLNQYTGVQATNPFARGGPSANDITAAIYLMLRTQDITSELFICPSTNLTPCIPPGMTSLKSSNFPGNQNLAYSYINVYPSAKAIEMGYKVNSTVGAELAIAADMNPGGTVLQSLTPQSPAAQIKEGNSKNHGGAGQNVLYGDGHCEFQQTPFCGQSRDCIYTVGVPGKGTYAMAAANSGTIIGSPAWSGDSVLLPVATIDPGYFTAGSMLVYLIIGLLVVGAVIGLILWLVLRNKKGPQAAMEGQMYPGLGNPAADAQAQQLRAMYGNAAQPPQVPGRGRGHRPCRRKGE